MLGSVSIQSSLANSKSYQVVANKEQENKSDKLPAFELKLKKIHAMEDPYQKSLALIKLGSEMNKAGIAEYKVGKVFKEAFDVALIIESYSGKSYVLSELGSGMDKAGFNKMQKSRVFCEALEALNVAKSMHKSHSSSSSYYEFEKEMFNYNRRFGLILCKMAKAGLYKEALFYTYVITDPIHHEGVIGVVISIMAEQGLTISQIRAKMHEAGIPNSDISKALKGTE